MASRKLYVTPKGRAIFPHLHEADTKFDADGVFGTKVAFPADDADTQALVKHVDTAVAENIAQTLKDNPKLKGKVKEADLPYKLDEEKNEYVFNFKLKAKGKTREGKEFTQRPMLFDAKGSKMEAKVGGGSQLRVSYEFNPFYAAAIGAGVGLRLKAAQIIELREFGERDAGSYGFEQEDGYEAEGSEFQQAAAPAAAADDTPPKRTESPQSKDF